jgi:thiamine-phosphate pyrophosphorylase
VRIPAFYPILDTATAVRRGVDPVEAARAMLGGGARILQFRHKTFYSRQAHAWLEAIAELCRQSEAALVVNDRADLAVLFGAALHLGQEDLPPEAARRVTGPDVQIGFSTHTEAQLRAADREPVDYLAIGPVFGTTSKENPDPVVGLAELKRLRPLTEKPLVGIGGITLTNARQAIEAGADSVAVIGDLFPESGGAQIINMEARAREWVKLLG